MNPTKVISSGQTDEEFGRAWAAQQRCAPHHYKKRSANAWRWSCFGEDTDQLWNILFLCLEKGIEPFGPTHPFPLVKWYATETRAYAALGRAVRAVHEAVPPLLPGKSAGAGENGSRPE